jgi:hypothetical protein
MKNRLEKRLKRISTAQRYLFAFHVISDRLYVWSDTQKDVWKMNARYGAWVAEVSMSGTKKKAVIDVLLLRSLECALDTAGWSDWNGAVGRNNSLITNGYDMGMAACSQYRYKDAIKDWEFITSDKFLKKQRLYSIQSTRQLGNECMAAIGCVGPEYRVLANKQSDEVVAVALVLES